MNGFKIHWTLENKEKELGGGEERVIHWVASCIVFSVTPNLEQDNSGNKLSARSNPKLSYNKNLKIKIKGGWG